MTHAADSLQHFADAFASSAALVLVSRVDDARVVGISANFLRLLGLRRDEVLGRTALELGLWRDESSRRAVLAMLKQRGMASAQPVSVRTQAGEHWDGLLNCCVIEHAGDPYLFTLLLDLRRHEDELLARQRELGSYRSLAMEAEVGLYRRRWQDGRLLEANLGLARVLGYRDVDPLLSSELPNRSLPYADPAEERGLRQQLLKVGGYRNQRTRLQRGDGSTLWVSESARLVRGSTGDPLYVEGTVLDISDLVGTEAALRQSEALYRNLVENSLDGVFLMQHGRVILANETLGRILGCPREQLLGKSYFDWVAPEDLAAQQARRDAREAGSTDTQIYEIHVLRGDGGKRLCAVRAGAVTYRGEPASIGTLRDITEERASQQRLQRAEARYRQLFRHAVLGMFQSTLEGRLIEVNEAMASMFGFESPEQMQREVVNMREWYVDPRSRDAALDRLLATGRLEATEFELLRRDGGSFWALASARLVREEGRPALLEGSLLDNTARRQAELELRFLAHHDALTGLDNRRRFEQRLEQALTCLRKDPADHRAVLLLDLDRFKVVNDSLGHAAGDQLLVEFARRLTRALGEEVWIARYGGDEFALLSRGRVEPTTAEDLSRRIHQLLSASFRVGGHQVFTGASIGVVLLDSGAREAEDLLRDADTAMFRAKAAGGGRHVLFDSSMHAAARSRLALETELRFALERDELLPCYQPIVNLDDGQWVGVETLVRWQHPVRGLLLPEHFLDVADESGLLPAIDLAMLRSALAHLARWQQRLGPRAPQRLSVNVSNRLFLAADFPARLAEMLTASGVAPACLHLEITESVMRGPTGGMRQTLAALQALGVRLVVDDFGTGYSSMVSFSDAAFDGLKIDRGFIHDLEHNPRHRAIVRTIAQFSRDLELSLVAEGVESPGQARLLRELGCELVQGHLYAAALPASVLEARLAAFGAAGME